MSVANCHFSQTTYSQSLFKKVSKCQISTFFTLKFIFGSNNLSELQINSNKNCKSESESK